MMNREVEEYLEKYSEDVVAMFQSIRQLLMEEQIISDERIWARIPSYYSGDNFVRLILFKDHINIEANAIIQHKDELKGYKITPKGMLQIFTNQDIPYDVLRQAFAETLA